MTAARSDASRAASTGQPRWERISEDEARAALGDEGFEDALAEIQVQGRLSAARYRAAGFPVVDQT